MTLDEFTLRENVDNAVAANPIKDTARHDVEVNLFKQGLINQFKQLNRFPKLEQINKAWQRWKEERGFEEVANKNSLTLYKKK